MLDPISAPRGYTLADQPDQVQPATSEYTAIDNLYRSFMHDTWLGESIIAGRAYQETIDEMGAFKPDPSYYPLLDEDNRGYEQYTLESRSPQESMYIRKRVDINNSGKRELEAGGAGVTRFLSQFADPVTYAPIPFTSGLKFVQAARKSVLPAAAAISASELMRAEFDPTVTGEELAFSIATGTILSSALVGGISHFTRGGRRADADFNEIVNRSESVNSRKTIEEYSNDLYPDLNVKVNFGPINETVRKPFPDGTFPSGFNRRYNDGRNEIFIDRERLDKDFERKAWLSPRKLADDSIATPLNRDFATPEDYARFVVAHEKTHVALGPQKADETLGQYEDRVNAQALIEYDKANMPRPVEVPRNLTEGLADAEARAVNYQTKINDLKSEVQQTRQKAKDLRDLAKEAKSQAWATRRNKAADELDAQADALDAQMPELESNARGIQNDIDSFKTRIDDIQNVPDPEMLAMVSTFTGLEKMRWSEHPWLRLINTKLRTMSPLLAGQWMKIAFEIAGSPGLRHKGAELGIGAPVSVEMLSKQWLNFHREALNETNNIYMTILGVKEATRGQVIGEKAKQFFGKTPENVPTFAEFRRSIGEAMMNNDAPVVGQYADQINQAVRVWRNMFDQFEKAGQETGVFQSLRNAEKNVEYWKARVAELKAKNNTGKAFDDAVANLAESEEALMYIKTASERGQNRYFHRMWRLDVIDRKTNEFKSLLRNHFTKNPYTIVLGKKTKLSTDPVDIEARVEETFAAIRKEAIFNDTMGAMNKGDAIERSKARIQELRNDIEVNGDKKLIDDMTVREVREAQIRNLEAKIAKGKGDGIGGPSPVLTRKLDINDYEFKEFLEPDIDIVGQHYTTRMAPLIEMARKFGDHRIEGRLAYMNQQLEKEIAAKPELADALRKEQESLNQAVFDLRDKVLGYYGIPDDPSAITPRVLRTLKAWNVLALMGKAWMAALADAGRIAMSEGFTRTFGTMFKNATDRIEKGRKSEFYIAGREIEMAGEAMDINNATRLHQMTDLGGGYYGMSKVERWVSHQQGPFFFLNMLSVWTDTAKRFAGGMIQSRMIEDSVLWSQGKLAGERMTRLAQAGIDENLAKRFARQWEEAGSSKGDHLFLANTEEWSDQEAVRLFRGIMATEVNTAVITPHAADKLNFMSKPMGSVLMQYRGFGLSATQRIMMSALQQRDKSALAGVVSMIALAGMVDYMRRPDYIELSLEDTIFRAVEKSGVTGIFSDINSALEVASGNQYGLRPLMGLEPVIKDPNWAQRTGAPLGAVATQWLQFIYAFSDSNATADDVASGIRYMIPYQNLWFWSDTFGRLERTLEDQLED